MRNEPLLNRHINKIIEVFKKIIKCSQSRFCIYILKIKGFFRTSPDWIQKNITFLDLLFTTLTFCVVSLYGTCLFKTQNQLLKSQNELLTQQMQLDEASRRSSLIMLMNNIIDKADKEIEEQRKLSPKDQNFSLSQSLVGQLAALSHSFRPYKYMDNDTLTKKPLSPERGQLLMTIAFLPLNSKTYSAIYKSSTFSGADMRFMRFTQSDLKKVDLKLSNFQEADLSKSILENADLRWSEMHSIILRDAKLTNADLKWTNMRSADLEGAIAFKTDLSNSDLTGANLQNVDFSRAKLSSVIFQEANFKNTTITINQLSRARTLYNCYNLHDSIASVLKKSHPELFEKPER